MLDLTFKFSQHSLTDFVECPRRFYLRYVVKQVWPLVETDPLGLDPFERQLYLWRGVMLHRWIERYWLGIPPSTSDDPELNLWWVRFLATDFSDLPEQRLPELALVAAIEDHQQQPRLLYARFDLLASEPGRAIIIDWKTLRGARPPRYQTFATRMQTRIYQYVLTTAGAAYNHSDPFAPEHIRMRYWLANFPDTPWIEVPYSEEQYARDREWLQRLIGDITRREGEAQFEMTSDERNCMYCTYRTLCRRTQALPPAQEQDQWVDIEAITELDY